MKGIRLCENLLVDDEIRTDLGLSGRALIWKPLGFLAYYLPCSSVLWAYGSLL